MDVLPDINLLDILLENMEEAFVLLDTHFIIKSFNHVAFKLTLSHFNKPLAKGESIYNFLTPGKEDEIAGIYRSVLSGETVQYPRTLTAADGKETTFKICNKPVKNQQGTIAGIIITTSNITDAVNAKLLVQQNERKYEALVREGADITAIIDFDANYLYVTPGCENMLGFTPEDFTGKNAFDFIHPQDKNRVYASFLQMKERKRVDIEPFRFLHKNNTWRWIETVATNVSDDAAVKGIVVNSRDVTEKKKIQDRLRVNEERLLLIYNTVSDVVYMLQEQDDGRYKYLTVNDTFYKVTGLAKEEVLNKYVDEVVKEPSYTLMKAKFKEAVKTRSRVSWEEVTLFPAGARTGISTITPVFDNERKRVQLVGSFTDITRQKSEQQQLQLLESVVKNTSDVVMITTADPIDKPGPFIVFVNETFTRLTGYTSEEVIGRTPRILQGKKTDKQQLKKLSDSLHQYQPCEVDLINYKKNGEEFWNNLTIFPIGNNKVHTHFIAFQKDITERKRLEQEREQLINNLTRSNQELKQFSYITSHNLRGPLTNLVAIASFIETKHITDEFTAALIEGFKTSTFKLNQTLDDLIKIFIIKETPVHTRQSVNFEDVYKATLTSISVLLNESGIRITTNFSAAQSVAFNNVYMQSIFLNLISNAMKYRHPERQPELKIYTQMHQTKVQLVFEDNGLGLDLSKINDRLFGLYQRFHTHVDGQGFGLYLIRSQIVSLDGTIDVQSVLNEGTRFTITFKNP